MRDGKSRQCRRNEAAHTSSWRGHVVDPERESTGIVIGKKFEEINYSPSGQVQSLYFLLYGDGPLRLVGDSIVGILL